ncbi:hypothetical protein QF032_003264 [Streptomyces achromogenes]|uniref:hypothetical protein n=1 Tax=Streptomyces achromogenes TaxID=67255 RepID=UPI00278A4388|nr:hypothetical protein [Streptomyces achromogenes]MDQ0831420.1 hypothetical protein [Streptomyces achromogenes]
MNEVRPAPVAWSDTAWRAIGCSVLCGLAYAVLALLGEDQLPVSAPVVMVLARWFWLRHGLWGPGAVAALAGTAVAFLVADALRPSLDRLPADTLATEAGLLVALVVFTVCSRLRST